MPAQPENQEPFIESDHTIVQCLESYIFEPHRISPMLISQNFSDHPSKTGTIEKIYAGMKLHSARGSGENYFLPPDQKRLRTELLPFGDHADTLESSQIEQAITEATYQRYALGSMIKEHAAQYIIGRTIDEEELEEHIKDPSLASTIFRHIRSELYIPPNEWRIIESQNGNVYLLENQIIGGYLVDLTRLAKRDKKIVKDFITEYYHYSFVIQALEEFLRRKTIHEYSKSMEFPPMFLELLNSESPKQDQEEITYFTRWMDRWNHLVRPHNDIVSIRYLNWDSVETIQYATSKNFLKKEALHHLGKCTGLQKQTREIFQKMLGVTSFIDTLRIADFRYEQFPDIPTNHVNALRNHRLWLIQTDLREAQDMLKNQESFIAFIDSAVDTGYAINNPGSFRILLDQYAPNISNSFAQFDKALEVHGISLDKTISQARNHFAILIIQRGETLHIDDIRIFVKKTLREYIQSGVDLSEFMHTYEFRSEFNPLFIDMLSSYTLTHVRQWLLEYQHNEGNRRVLHSTKNALIQMNRNADAVTKELKTGVDSAQKDYLTLTEVLDIAHVDANELQTVCQASEDDEYNFRSILLINVLYLHHSGKINIQKRYGSYLLEDIFPWMTPEIRQFLQKHSTRN